MQNMFRRGQTLTWRNDSGKTVKGGQLVIVGDLVGVAAKDITEDAQGALAMEGVYRLPKDNAAIAVGLRVFVDDDGKITSAAGDHPAVAAWAPATDADSIVLVKINV